MVRSSPALSALAEDVAEVTRKRTRVAPGRRDDKARVVAGKRSHDPLVLELVERSCDRRRGTQFGLHDDDVARGGYAPAELSENAVEQLARVEAPDAVRDDVARSAQRVVRLLEAQFTDVARDRRLSDGAARICERREQLELRADPFSRDDAFDQPLPLTLRQRPTVLHKSEDIYAGLSPRALGQDRFMLRKLLWTALYGGMGAVATIVSRRTASGIWRTLTGEEPPTKK